MLNIRVAVNVSPLQLRRRDFVDRVLASIAPSGSSAAGLDIEITESMLMHDLELSIRKLAQLREAGLGVAIDDFGTGYSSLRLLAKLPVDTLKIDKSFVQSIVDTPNVATLVSTVISLARAFNMKTVAEGVETCRAITKIAANEVRPSAGISVQPTGARRRSADRHRSTGACTVHNNSRVSQSRRFDPVDFHSRMITLKLS